MTAEVYIPAVFFFLFPIHRSFDGSGQGQSRSVKVGPVTDLK
jgi:hypothetical protein